LPAPASASASSSSSSAAAAAAASAAGAVPSHVSLRCLATLSGHSASVNVARFSDSGTYLLSGGADRALLLWNPWKTASGDGGGGGGGGGGGSSTESPSAAAAADGEGGEIEQSSAVLPPAAKKARRMGAAASASASSAAAASSVHLIHRFPSEAVHSRDVLDVSLSSANDRFLSCGRDRFFSLWDIEANSVVRRFRAHDGDVFTVQLNGGAVGDSLCASGGFDKRVMVWDMKVKAGAPVQCMQHAKDTIVAVRWTVHALLAASSDGWVRQYDIRRGLLVSDYHGQALSSLALSHDQRCYLASAIDGSIKLFAIAGDGALLQEYRGHSHGQALRLASAFTFDDAHVLSASEDGALFVYDLLDPALHQRAHAHRGATLFVDPHPSKHAMVSCGSDARIKLWEHSPPDSDIN
jgi:mitogen-activated protein kinase organizer 1